MFLQHVYQFFWTFFTIMLKARILSEHKLITALLMLQAILQSVHTELPSWTHCVTVSAPLISRDFPVRDSLSGSVRGRASTSLTTRTWTSEWRRRSTADHWIPGESRGSQTEAFCQRQIQLLSCVHSRHKWLGSWVAKALDLQLAGCEFNSRPRRCRVTTLGKLFTPACLSRSQWFSDGMIDCGVRGRG